MMNFNANTHRLGTKNRLVLVLVQLLLMASVAMGQLIGLKTVPVATGDQFLLHPSQNMGMGSVNISLSDSLLDPWVNPAHGNTTRGARITSSPVYYHVGNGYGDARAMPMALTWSDDIWFGGVSLAIQAMSLAESQNFWGPDVRTLSTNLSENKYFSGFLGRRLGSSSVGVGVSHAMLSALDGVDLLYANSVSIEQEGSITDVRLGIQRQDHKGFSQELLLIYNELDMLHKVHYEDWWGWEELNERIEKNLDHTVTLGFHAALKAPLKAPGWQVGGIFTLNYKDHPKIPNYEIMNIPRDPGNTTAFNFGFGLSKQDGASRFGIDMVYEPIISNTWAAADTFIIDASDHLIRPGDKTIENDFEFSNWVLRTGLGWSSGPRDFQFGLQMRNIHYWLDQHDYVAITDREQEEYWVEWTTTWGVTMHFSDFDVSYNGRTTMGTGRPGVDTQWIRFATFEDANFSGDFIIAPSDDLTLTEARVMTHQITLSLPIGR